jgi:hypothetical protein
MKTYGGVDVYIHTYFTPALVGGEWSASSPGRFTQGERAAGEYSTLKNPRTTPKFLLRNYVLNSTKILEAENRPDIQETPFLWNRKGSLPCSQYITT